MSDVKKKLNEEIDKKIKRKRELRAQNVNKSIIDAFVLAFIANVEDVNTMVSDERSWLSLTSKAIEALEGQIRSFDWNMRLQVNWLQQEDKLPLVNGVTITWSKEYQAKNNCDEQLFVDATSLLFQ